MHIQGSLLLLALAAPPASAALPQQALAAVNSLGDAVRGTGSGITVRSSSFDGTSHDDSHGAWTASRPDGHAPIGVMADHMHGAGEWMLSIRAMRMHMEGMRDGTSSISNAEVFGKGFMVTPLEMDMDMVMFGAMYAPTDDLTVMAMVPYLSNSMDHLTGMGGRFTTESEGLGDVRLGGLYSLFDEDGERVHLNVSLSFPTGSTDERDDTPVMADAKLPYPMQLGTGTFDFLPGVTYLGQRGDWSWGAQAVSRFHVGENDEGYRRGNRFDATGWVARRVGPWSLSLRLNAMHWSSLHGSDSDLNPGMVPTADPDLQGGDRLDALAGVNYHFHGGALAGHRIALEFGAPVFEDLNGPQLGTDWIATLGWQYAF